MSNPNEPAFPVHGGDADAPTMQGGLTKRELIAAMALQGILAAGSGGQKEHKVDAAIDFADMLIEALSIAKEPPCSK